MLPRRNTQATFQVKFDGTTKETLLTWNTARTPTDKKIEDLRKTLDESYKYLLQKMNPKTMTMRK